MMPKISIIMPAFNGEQYISAAIASVLAQDMPDFELIVVDDGSADATSDIAIEYSKRDLRVRVVSIPNSGRPSIPKNLGISLARSEYIGFLDHDDLYDVGRLGKMVDALERHPDWVAVFHDLRMIDAEGKLLPGTYLTNSNFFERASPFLKLIEEDLFECGESFFVYQSLIMGALHTQSVLIAANRLPLGTVSFDTRFTIGEDTDLWIRLGLLGKMGFLDKVLSSYRQHGESITRNLEKALVDGAAMHVNNLSRIKTKLTLKQYFQYRAKIAGYSSDLAYLRYKQYRQVEARKAYFNAIKWLPNREAALGYIKTLVPVYIMQKLKQMVNGS